MGRGGIWHNPGFEERHDCIWDGENNFIKTTEIELNNMEAKAFIIDESMVHDVFIISIMKKYTKNCM